ncbi:MAG TPA: hypothetical protein VLA43_16520 [Longimicrobiales bacterium]|nr:hypothetical protein [Longimicrobiales bacterium]
MKKKTLGRIAKYWAMVKAPRLTYLLRHPIRGPRNLLALRGAKSLLKTRGAKVTAAALATTAVAVPLAMKAMKEE